MSLAPLINFCKYSKLYFALQFSASIFASSPENSDLAEFKPFASTINFPESIENEHASDTTAQSSIEATKSIESISTLEVNSILSVFALKSISSTSISNKFKVKFLLILS